ncbi:MAG: hypothetical protein V4534_03305 [Myxococcota bacterium]
MKLFAFVSFIISLSAFAEGNTVGGECAYKKIPGVATVTAVEACKDAQFYQCKKDPVFVDFEFKPDNAAEDVWPETNIATYTTADGMLPSLAWATENGLKVGAKFKVTKFTIEKGTCTPIDYEFPKFTDVPAYCF